MATAPFDVLTATASELEPLLASGKVTSVQLIEIYLAEIEKNNGYLKAVISTAPKNSLIEKANALDGERSSGTTRSHLHGLPILVKVELTLTKCFIGNSQSQGQHGYSPRPRDGHHVWQLRPGRSAPQEKCRCSGEGKVADSYARRRALTHFFS